MITVDEAIRRGLELRWGPGISYVDSETAYQDRALLAAEVVVLRDVLRETEEEVDVLRRELEPELPPFA